jgi:CRP/FNR family transcriptional regulator
MIFEDHDLDAGWRHEAPSRFLQLRNGTAELDRLGMLKRVAKGTVIMEPGDRVDHCYVVIKGCVIGYDITPAGDERIYNIMLPNSLMLEACAFLGRPSPVYFKAVKNSELIAIPRNTLISDIRHNPQVAITVIESLCHKYLSATEQVRELKCQDATWMLCNLFLIFAKTYGVPHGNKILIKEKVSQQTLSDLLGINRITTVRIISKLKDHGLIEQLEGFYCIPDLEELYLYMEFLEDTIT